MKASFVSSAAVSQAMRYSLQRMQSELVGAQKEVSTGMVADAGLALGMRTGQSVSFSRDIDRFQAIVDSNEMIASRLTATQDALSQVTTVSERLLQTLTADTSGVTSPTVVETEARSAIEALTSILNSSLSGEYLFAGVNTDVSPINDFSDPASPNKMAFDADFLAHFGFTQSDPLAANITAAQMDTFLDTVVEPQFLGAGWQTNWSNATDEKIVNRIALNETAPTSVSANEIGLRKLAMAAATLSDLFGTDINPDAREALVSRAIELVSEGMSGITSVQAETGVTENRVARASERVTMQIDLFKTSILDMEAVDPYEASTRVNSLLSQIEVSYALTARIQQLSLVNYLT
jgi:flagellar hook-associated protein 3 FlgL